MKPCFRVFVLTKLPNVQAGMLDANGYLSRDPRGRASGLELKAVLDVVIPESMDSLVADR